MCRSIFFFCVEIGNIGMLIFENFIHEIEFIIKI